MQPLRLCLRIVLAAALCGALPLARGARAHTLPISYLTIVPATDYVHVELSVNPFELVFFAELDRNRNRLLEAAELHGREEAVARRVFDCLKLRVGGKPVGAETVGVLPEPDGHHVTFRGHYPVDARGAALALESNLTGLTSGSHLTQITYGLGEHQQKAQLDAQSRSVTFPPLSAGGGVVVGAVRPLPAAPVKRLLAVASLGVLLGGLCVTSLVWRARRHAHPSRRSGERHHLAR
jgi:hypothetical protein